VLQRTRWSIRERVELLLPGSIAVALYQRDSELFQRIILNWLTTDPDEYRGLLDAARARGDETFYWDVFRHVATEAMWERSLHDLLAADVPGDQIVNELTKREPQKYPMLNVEIGNALVDKYGDAVLPYLGSTSLWFFRREIEAVLDANLDNETLLQRMSQMAAKHYDYLAETADVWALPLYERDASYFEPFLRDYLVPRWRTRPLTSAQQRAVQYILSHAEAREQDTLFRALYGRVATEATWNQEIQELAQSALSDAALLQAIDRHAASFTLDGQAALALYTRNPDLFGEFIRGRIGNLSGSASQLLMAAREHGDEDLYWSMFRQWATPAAWHDELQVLLAQDIPAESISQELEKRHPETTKGLNPAALRGFLDKYGVAVMPYLERHFHLATRERIESLLALPLERAAVLHELDSMATREPVAFASFAELWAFALYDRDPVFFEGFLVRRLDLQQASVIQKLLPRIEAAGQESLFKSLYRKIAREEDWNYELRTLVSSSRSDAEIKTALEMREPRWATMTDATAQALYRRNPDLFRDYIKRYLHPHWYQNADDYQQLRQAARDAGDEEFFWYLFRESSSRQDWQHHMENLLASDIPAERIAAELERCLPEHPLYNFQPVILLKFLDKYGAAALPPIQRFLPSISRDAHALDTIKKLGDETLYWQVFFSVANAHQWNQELREMLRSTRDDEELVLALQIRTPYDAESFGGRWRWQRWGLEPDVALAMYQRQPVFVRPFLERFLSTASAKLVEAAAASHDREFLDFLLFRLMQQAARLVHEAYPPERYWRWQQPNAKARQQLTDLGALVVRYLDQLYAESPEVYVRHAANILARFRAFEVWAVQAQLEHNPIFAYLAGQHREAWQHSPDGIRELMESPNIYVQILGIDFLSDANAETAQRIVDNLYIFRALLLAGRSATRKEAGLPGTRHAARAVVLVDCPSWKKRWITGVNVPF
jgi:hypothetical protein